MVYIGLHYVTVLLINDKQFSGFRIGHERMTCLIASSYIVYSYINIIDSKANWKKKTNKTVTICHYIDINMI